MRPMNVLFPEQKDEAAFIETWLKHRGFSVPKINSALNGALEFMDSSLMVGTDKDGKRVHISDSYWLERDDFDRFWGTQEGEDVTGNLKGYWPNFGRWRGLLPGDAKVIAGVERPVVAVYGHKAISLAEYPSAATALLARPERPWQVELYAPRMKAVSFAAITLVTLPDQGIWEESRASLADQLLGFAATEFMGVLWTPELPDLDHPNYDRVFSQTQRGVRKNSIPAEVSSGDGSET